MDYKLKRCLQAALLAAAWLPYNALAAQLGDAEPSGDSAKPAPADSVEVEVDLAFIEFLGQWEADDGEWIAPSDLSDEIFVELIETMATVESEQID